jgi:prepilin-type N-terminal cleavage/methylation domain-containing protein
MMSSYKRSNDKGFTIIELMIATLVFSVVLLLLTVGVRSFNDAYYKGVTQSTTQSAARTIIEDITQSIQFSGGQVTSPIGTTGSGSSVGFCVGDQRYSYLLGWELVTGTANASLHQTNHALALDSPGECSGLNAQNMQGASVSGTELLGSNMRVSALSVTQVAGSNNLYKINVRVVYGADDLLYSPSGATPAATAPDATCKLQTGDQFCAVSNLSTIVQMRIS